MGYKCTPCVRCRVWCLQQKSAGMWRFQGETRKRFKKFNKNLACESELTNKLQGDKLVAGIFPYRFAWNDSHQIQATEIRQPDCLRIKEKLPNYINFEMRDLDSVRKQLYCTTVQLIFWTFLEIGNVSSVHLLYCTVPAIDL